MTNTGTSDFSPSSACSKQSEVLPHQHDASAFASANEGANVNVNPRDNSLFVGKSFLTNMWYFAVAGSKLKPGKMISKTMLGELILVGRDEHGKVFAMQDICPHQGVQLSKGEFDGCQIECCFHGWKFGTDGVCSEIPSLCEGQKLNLCSIRTKSYPVREVQGNVWVYFGEKVADDELPEVPFAPGLEGYNYWQTTTTLLLPNHIDYNAVALIDTAHVPYVHKSWWWRSKRKLKEKQKTYVPSETGWTMVKHKPSKHSIVFNLFGDYIETEISFRLPACRREYLTFHGRTTIAGISCLTPIDENWTELNHTTFLTIPFIKPLAEPIVQYFVRTFLGQDQYIADMQKVCLPHNPNLIMTVKDSGTPGRWYFLLKKEWTEATQQKRPFVNPIKESILRWKT